MPEIDSVIQRFAGRTVQTIFTPHLVSMDRGILSTIYVQPTDGTNPESLLDALRFQYASKSFHSNHGRLPTTKEVSGTNFCDIGIKECRGTIVIVSALDNLIKGASGAAVQNFNVMFDLEQTTSFF